ncbi:hypothetical protein PUR28_19985 [Streptomyces sp. BE308]|nr:hypothetical protein [Streptomyces sp. BE308]MEE1793007.1 hypothetical protein [Streptomyces sp. BE308]
MLRALIRVEDNRAQGIGGHGAVVVRLVHLQGAVDNTTARGFQIL